MRRSGRAYRAVKSNVAVAYIDITCRVLLLMIITCAHLSFASRSESMGGHRASPSSSVGSVERRYRSGSRLERISSDDGDDDRHDDEDDNDVSSTREHSGTTLGDCDSSSAAAVVTYGVERQDGEDARMGANERQCQHAQGV